MTNSTMDPITSWPVATVARRADVGQPLPATEAGADTAAAEVLSLVQAAIARAEQAGARLQSDHGRLNARNTFD